MKYHKEEIVSELTAQHLEWPKAAAEKTSPAISTNLKTPLEDHSMQPSEVPNKKPSTLSAAKLKKKPSTGSIGGKLTDTKKASSTSKALGMGSLKSAL